MPVITPGASTKEPWVEYDLSPGTPLGDHQLLKEVITGLPWYDGNKAGAYALQHAAEAKQYPKSDMVQNKKWGMYALNTTPHHYQSHYQNQDDPRAKVLEDAKAHMEQTIEDNLSPEVRSQIEDLKLLAAEVFSEMNRAGVLPFFDQQKVVKGLAELKFNLYGHFDEVNNGTTAAFYRPYAHEVGSIGLGNLMNQVNFIHELTHAVLEARTLDSRSRLGNICSSIKEATVQHIANRGYGYFKRSHFETDATRRILRFTPQEKRANFNKTKFTKYDVKGQYEEDRRIMYELCEGSIEVQDFVNALTDPTSDSLDSLEAKLAKEFPELPEYLGYPLMYLLSVIHQYIDGPLAEANCHGIEERNERAEFLLKKIWMYKNKRDLEQAWTARTAAKKAYAHARKAAIQAHSSYFS